MRKLFTWAGWAFLILIGLPVMCSVGVKVIGGTQTGSQSAIPPLLQIELDYWDATHPLVERAVIEAGTPLSLSLVENQTGMIRGDVDAWDAFVSAAKEPRIVYGEVLAAWLEIHPPNTDQAVEMYRAYGEAWAARTGSLDMMIIGWDDDDLQLLTEGLEFMDEAGALGQKAEASRRAYTQYLVQKCEGYGC